MKKSWYSSVCRLVLCIVCTLGQKSSIYPEIHKISFFTKFIISKSYFSQNSHFQSPIFHKIHILKVSFFTKFTFFKHEIIGNFWIKSCFFPQCVYAWQNAHAWPSKLLNTLITNLKRDKYICNSIMGYLLVLFIVLSRPVWFCIGKRYILKK